MIDNDFPESVSDPSDSTNFHILGPILSKSLHSRYRSREITVRDEVEPEICVVALNHQNLLDGTNVVALLAVWLAIVTLFAARAFTTQAKTRKESTVLREVVHPALVVTELIKGTWRSL